MQLQKGADEKFGETNSVTVAVVVVPRASAGEGRAEYKCIM